MRDTYLYRAVNAADVVVIHGYEDDGSPIREVAAPGMVTFGRQSGYLSRSGARAAGERSGNRFEVVRSEPVRFLTREEALERDIDALTAKLHALRG